MSSGILTFLASLPIFFLANYLYELLERRQRPKVGSRGSTLYFFCPHCREHLEEAASNLGMTLSCPTCGNEVIASDDPQAHPDAEQREWFDSWGVQVLLPPFVLSVTVGFIASHSLTNAQDLAHLQAFLLKGKD